MHRQAWSQISGPPSTKAQFSHDERPEGDPPGLPFSPALPNRTMASLAIPCLGWNRKSITPGQARKEPLIFSGAPCSVSASCPSAGWDRSRSCRYPEWSRRGGG